jgi:hypothetical protein
MDNTMAAGRLIVEGMSFPITKNGASVAGASLTVYLNGTTTKAAVFQDLALTTPATNPQLSNAAGFCHAQSTSLYMDGFNLYTVQIVLRDGETRTYNNLSVGGEAKKSIDLADFATGGADDTIGVRAWLDALKSTATATGRALGTISSVYNISGSCQLLDWTGEIEISRTVAGAGFNLIGTNPRFDGIYIGGSGVFGATTTITANAALGDPTITVASTSALSVGSFIELAATSVDGNVQLSWNRVHALVGNLVTLETPLAFEIIAANVTRVQPTKLQSGLTISGMDLTSTSTGQVQGLSCYNLVDPQISDIDCRSFSSLNSSAFVAYGIYTGSINNVRDIGSGYNNGSSSDDIVITATGTSIARIKGQRASGFGIGYTNCHRCTIIDSSAIRANGRAIKFTTSTSNKIIGMEANSVTTFVGIALTGGTRDNQFSSVSAHGCLVGSATGIWLNGAGNRNNTFTDVNAKSSAYDIFVGTTDTGNVFDMVNNDIGTIDSTTSGAIVRTARRSLTRATPAANQSIPNAVLTKVALGTVIDDLNGEWVGGTNRFVVKRPGYYSLKGIVSWTAAPGVGFVDLVLNVNNQGYVRPSTYRRDLSNLQYGLQVSAMQYLKEGAFVELHTLHNAGAARDTFFTAFSHETVLEVVGL